MRRQLASRCAVVLSALLLMVSTAFANTYHKRIIAHGSEFGSIDGIEFDQDNNLWVSVLANNNVLKLSKNGTLLETFGPDQGVTASPDLTVGPDNLVYFVEIISGQVKRINADGTITTIATGMPGVDAIAFNQDGRLFVSAFFPGVYDQILEVDPTGANPPVVKINNPGFINQFAFGADGLLYGPQTFGDSVVKINVDTGQITTVASGFTSPIVSKFDRDGHLYVVDEAARKIFRVDTATGIKILVVDNIQPGTNAIAFNRNNKLYFGSAETGFLGRLNNAGAIVPLAKEGMVFPGGVAVIPGNHGRDKVWVADFFSVRVFNGLNGRQKKFFPGNSASEFVGPGVGFPTDISVGDNDTFVLTSSFLAQVRVWNPDTNATTLYQGFAAPAASIAFQSDVAVSELATGQVVRASDRAVLGSGLILPTGLVAIGNDLFVAEFGTGSIKQIVDNGTVLSTPVVVASGLAAPEGMALDEAGTGLYVVEVGMQRLTRVEIATGQKTVIANNLQVGETPPVGGAPAGLTLSSVGVGSNGVLYVTGDDGRVLYRLTPHNLAQ